MVARTEEKKIEDLNDIDAPRHNAPRPELQGLSDEELIDSLRNPSDGDRAVEKNGKLLDGNGRVKEAKRRGLGGITIPVDIIESDGPLADWEK